MWIGKSRKRAVKAAPAGDAAAAIQLAGRDVPIKVRRSALARRYRLSVDGARGEVRLSLPLRASLPRAIAWAQEQGGWIADQLGAVPDPVALADGVVIPLEGMDVRIFWLADAPRGVERDGAQLRVGGPKEQVGPRVLRWLQARAKLVLEAETRAMARSAGLPLTGVGIGDPRARWGSCSASGTIRYSWRLILVPEFVRRATVAHEVAHLAHLDHSPRFHAFHRELLGEDPRPARAWLKMNGTGLHRIG